jgi:hypothetical protein
MSPAIHFPKTMSKYLLRLWCILGLASIGFLLLGIARAVGTGSPDETVLLPRGPERTIELASFQGQTYLQAMQAHGTGIFDKTDADDTAAVTIADADQIVNDVTRFDSKVSERLFGMFQNGQSDLQSLMAKIQGKSFSPQNMWTGLKPLMAQANLKPSARANLALDASADMALLASGSGTLVKINSTNYFYNLGYQKPVVQSGRSFGVAPGRSLLDSSDKDYLTELAEYSKPGTTPDASPFYTAILKVLTNCNTSDFANLPMIGQVVATDFVTIYTAELERHVMVNLVPNQHPWEIDLAEVTFLNSYGAASGMVMQKGALGPGTAVAYYAVGTKGSGIGETRADFVKLATLITRFENDPLHHPELVSTIVKITPIQDKKILAAVGGDVIRRLLVYLNRPEFQSDIRNHPSDFTNAMVAFLKQINADSAPITQYIQNNP